MGKSDYKLRPETIEKYGKALDLLYNIQQNDKGGKFPYTKFIAEHKLNSWLLPALKSLSLVDHLQRLKKKPNALTSVDVCNEINRLLYSTQAIHNRKSYIKKGRDIKTNTIIQYLKDNKIIKPQDVYIKDSKGDLIPIVDLIKELNPDYK